MFKQPPLVNQSIQQSKQHVTLQSQKLPKKKKSSLQLKFQKIAQPEDNLPPKTHNQPIIKNTNQKLYKPNARIPFSQTSS